jgi:hypothetical protein
MLSGSSKSCEERNMEDMDGGLGSESKEEALDKEGIVEFREMEGLVERLAIWEERAESIDARDGRRAVGEGVSR